MRKSTIEATFICLKCKKTAGIELYTRKGRYRQATLCCGANFIVEENDHHLRMGNMGKSHAK